MPLEIMEMARKASLAGSEAFDIVGVAPPVDVAQMTAKLAASLMLEMMTGVAYRSRKLFSKITSCPDETVRLWDEHAKAEGIKWYPSG